MKEKKPWYVRFTEFGWEKNLNIPGWCTPLIVLILFILVFAISFGIAKNKPIEKSYEEASDIEFKTYVNETLEKIFQTTIDEDNRIILAEIPDVILKYDIRRTEQGIELYYLLNKEKIIENYELETGKTSIFNYSDSEDKFEMNIQISSDFKDITKTSSIEILTREEYKEKYPRIELVNNTIEIMLATILGIMLLYILCIILSIGPAIATFIWRRKQKKAKLS